MTDKITIARGAAKLVISTSVGSVITKALKTHVTPESTLDHVQLAIGAYAVGAMVSDRAGAWTEAQIDELLEAIREFKSRKDEEPSTEESNPEE